MIYAPLRVTDPETSRLDTATVAGPMIQTPLEIAMCKISGVWLFGTPSAMIAMLLICECSKTSRVDE